MSSDLPLPTFGDMPGPGEPAPEPQAKPAEQAAPPQTVVQPVYVPVPTAPPTNPAETDAAVYRAMSQIEAQRERANRSRELSETWKRLNTPPPLPEDPDELLSDGEKLAAALEARDRWVQQAMNANVGPIVQRMQEVDKELSTMKALNADIAARSVADELARRGIPSDPQVWNDVEGMLRANPDNYWSLKQSPQALMTAYQVVMANRQANGQPAPVQYQQAPPPTAGAYTPPQQAQSYQKPPRMLHLERMLGVTFTPEEVAESINRRGVN